MCFQYETEFAKNRIAYMDKIIKWLFMRLNPCYASSEAPESHAWHINFKSIASQKSSL